MTDAVSHSGANAAESEAVIDTGLLFVAWTAENISYGASSQVTRRLLPCIDTYARKKIMNLLNPILRLAVVPCSSRASTVISENERIPHVIKDRYR